MKTTVGYAGGTTESPTYRSMGDHAECVQVTFDPEQVSFEELLERFWEWHSPFRAAWSRQYMSAVFYHNEAQQQAIERSLERLREVGEPKTEVQACSVYTLAEDYHQNYYLKCNRTLARELADDSYEATKANAIMGGHLTWTPEQVAELGLSEKAQSALLGRRRKLLGLF